MTADAVIQPTLLEWFGRIYLEFFDVPILTSGRDFAHEHCPDATIYFDPSTLTAWQGPWRKASRMWPSGFGWLRTPSACGGRSQLGTRSLLALRKRWKVWCPTPSKRGRDAGSQVRLKGRS